MNKGTIAYLCSEYPAVSHTFIHREIESLRLAGMTVHTATIRNPAQVEVMTKAEQEEADRTLKVLSQPVGKIAKAHLHCIRQHPAGYLRMAATASRLLFAGPKSPVKAAAYFIEAGILLEWLHSIGVTHVHEHFANPTAIVAMLMQSYGGVSYSTSVHGPDIFYSVDSSMLAEKVRNASFVRCISHYCQSQIMRISDAGEWDRLHIIRCGVDPEKYAIRPEPCNPVPELLCVGRLVPAKGQHILLHACLRLRQEGYSFHVTLVGDGPDRASLEKFVADNDLGATVAFTGALGQEQVHRQYDRADIFVLASFAEGVPVVLMEAMAKEIPAISTRITGIPELIEDEEDGLLARPGDTEDLASKIRMLLDDPCLRSKLGKAGRCKVVDHYNQHRNNAAMVDLFNQASLAS
jgi:colanic acid/amylovoran biosynthesis glycosyltransferase